MLWLSLVAAEEIVLYEQNFMATENAHSISPVESDHVGWAIFGDFHQSVIGETTSLSAVPYDQYIPSAVRPPALILASGLINRQAINLMREHGNNGWQESLVGDYIDASTRHEWLLFLSTTQPEIWKGLLPSGYENWNEEEWGIFFADTRNLFSWPRLEEILTQRKDQMSFPLAAPGNHDGELHGSVIGSDDPHGATSRLIPGGQRGVVGNGQLLDDRGWMESYLSARYGSESIQRHVVEMDLQAQMGWTDDTRKTIFDRYWHRMSNNDFVCLVHVPHKAFADGAFFGIQARKVSGDVGGRPVFEIILDTSDMSGRLPANAAVGMISAHQRNLLRLFIEEMRDETERPLFIFSGHVDPHEQDAKNWKEVGMDDFLAQGDVLPVAFYANGHHRDLTNEVVGGRVNREGGAWSVMTPAIIDAPNEFMTMELQYDASARVYVMMQQYHSALPDEASFDEDVRAAVHQFDEQLSCRHYADYSEMSSKPIPTVWNALFRKKAVAQDAALVQLRSLREDLGYVERYFEFLKTDPMIPETFTRFVEYHLEGLKHSVEDESLKAPTQEALLHAQALQFYISQTPPDSKAAQFMLLLGKKAAQGEGIPGVRHGLRYREPNVVNGINVFRWHPETDVVTHH